MTKVEILSRALESLEFVIGDLDYLDSESLLSPEMYAILRGKAGYLRILIKEEMNDAGEN